MIEDANVVWRNFSGKEGRFNQEGERNFLITLSEDTAAHLLDEGWNVKRLKPRLDEEVGPPCIQIGVRFDKFPPRIVLLTDTSRVQLEEETIEVLDWATFANVDLIVRANVWNVNGKTGLKAYVQSMFVTIEEDALERKYQINEDPPETAKV